VKQPAIAFHELLQHSEYDAAFLPNIITGNETWVDGYNPDKEKKVFTMEDIIT
jgi:hypothetical protein